MVVFILFIHSFYQSGADYVLLYLHTFAFQKQASNAFDTASPSQCKIEHWKFTLMTPRLANFRDCWLQMWLMFE